MPQILCDSYSLMIRERKVLKTCFLLLIFCFSPLLVAKPTLTVYTYSSFAAEWGPGPAIKQAFEASCNCQLKWVALADGVALLNRLRMEGKNSPADVVLGLDNNLIQAAESTGLFTESNVSLRDLSVPGGWQHPLFVPYDYGYFAFIYNQQKLKNPPSSLRELIDSPQQLRIIYQDPRTSTPGLGLLLWINKVYGEKSAKAWQKLAKKTVTVTKGWSEAWGLFLRGESDMVLSYSTSPAYQLAEDKQSPLRTARFAEGHYLQIEVAGQLASSQQPELAQRFMRFILSPDFQRTIPAGNWMYPVTGVPLPASFDALQQPEPALSFTPQQVEQQRQQWVREWQSAVTR